MNKYHVTGTLQVLHAENKYLVIDNYVVARDIEDARKTIMSLLPSEEIVLHSMLDFENINEEQYEHV